MLSLDLGKWICVAYLIAWPVSLYLVRLWLHGFAYRAEPGVGVFLLAAAVIFVVAGLTVGHHTLSAARADPVNSLRDE